MKVGEVFIWHNFPYHRDIKSLPKKRLFIFLGTTGLFSSPIFALMCTTTTQHQKYTDSKTSIYISAINSCFNDDCVVDLERNFYDEISLEMIQNNPDIESIGRIDDYLLKRIFDLASKTLSKRIVRDIHDSLNRDGFTGFKRPT